ncbi:MFS transporter [Lysinibacillus xylanilyticus]|uniref:MFS transporter n=1 Tax=Lysinibacillus xylanilyticus TaxID=582475 RepID=A0ABT4EVM9_9BACI|nr:MFS transporter [Lysinibacillus xylanilyticus]MCY9549593.1 MFS transporter [Lysinibacillus xylanilyticus]
MLSSLGILKNKNFSLLITSESTSLFGTLFLNVALSLYVLKLTGSPEKFAAVLALGIVPHIILGSVSGILADKFDKKRWVITFDILRGLLCLGLFAFSFIGSINLPLIYFTVIFISSCDILFTPMFMSILPTIVPQEKLVEANSVSRTLNETMKVLSPLLGTLAYTLAGLGTVFLVNGLSFFVSAITIYLMKLPEKGEPTGKKLTFLRDISEGFRIIYADKRLLSVVSNAFLTHTFLYPFLFVGIPYIIVNVLAGKNTDYGLVESVTTIGSIMAIFVVPITKNLGVSKNIGIGLLGMLVPVGFLFFLGNSDFIRFLTGHSLYIVSYFSIINFILFLAFSFYVVYFASYYQSEVPQESYGRFIASVIVMNGIGKVAGYNVVGMLFATNSLIYPLIFLAIGMSLKLIVHIPFMIITRNIEKGTKVENSTGVKA